MLPENFDILIRAVINPDPLEISFYEHSKIFPIVKMRLEMKLEKIENREILSLALRAKVVSGTRAIRHKCVLQLITFHFIYIRSSIDRWFARYLHFSVLHIYPYSELPSFDSVVRSTYQHFR